MPTMSQAARLQVSSAAVATASAVTFAVVYALTVRTIPGRELDDASLRGALRGQSPASELVDRVLGVVSTVSLIAAVAFLLLLALVRLQRSLGLAAFAVLLLANLGSRGLKNLLPRPDLGIAEFTPSTLNSMPSGHTTAAFSAVVALLFVVPPRFRGPVAIGGGGLSCLVAVATMFAGWHRAADSMASFLLVTAVAAGAVAVLGAVLPADVEFTGSSPWQDRGMWATLSAISVVLGLMLVAGLLVSSSVRESLPGQLVAVATGVIFVTATAMGALVTLLALLDRVHPETVESPTR